MTKVKFILALLELFVFTIPALAQFNNSGGIVGPLSPVTGSVALYVNPSSSSTTPCGVSGGSTCQAGSDNNACVSIAAPCQTFQHAISLIAQTRLWGINIGSAAIYLGNGTYPEVITFPALLGAPVPGGANKSALQIIGNASVPANVIISAPNDSCTSGAVLTFQSGSTVWIHDFTVTAVNEVTLGCHLVKVNKGAYVNATGTMDYGVPGGANDVIQIEGGSYSQAFQSPAATMNVAAGTGGYAWIEVYGWGNFYDDNSNVNFVSTNTFSRAMMVSGSPGGWIATPDTVTFTGAVTSTNCFYARQGGHIEGSNFSQGSGLTEMNYPWASCTVSAGQRNSIQNVVADGATVGSMEVASQFATNRSQGSAPTVSSCGSGASQVDTQSTDQSGFITEGSGATACTVVFANSYPLRPNCTVTPYGAATLVTNYTINGSGSAWTGFTVSNSGGAINFDYTCWHHY